MTTHNTMNMLTQHNNLGSLASVEDLPFTERKFTYNRGYGNTVIISDKPNNKISTTVSPYNRLQPLMGEFGLHSPKTADKEFKMLNPQTNIAWDNNPKIQ
jgi:hypothetical protein